MSTREQVLNRLYTLLVVAVVVFLAAIYARPTEPRVVTLGALSEQTSDLRDQRVVVVNAVNGTRDGRYVAFDTDNPLRRRVVLYLVPDHVPSSRCHRFTGYCVGVVDRLPHCPFDGPFVLVVDARCDD